MPFDGTEFGVTQLSPATQALIAARRRLKTDWTQGAMRRGYRVCMAGALTERDPFQEPAIKFLAAALGTDIAGIPRWNDALGRSLEEVLAVMDRAIELSLA